MRPFRTLAIATDASLQQVAENACVHLLARQWDKKSLENTNVEIEKAKSQIIQSALHKGLVRALLHVKQYGCENIRNVVIPHTVPAVERA